MTQTSIPKRDAILEKDTWDLTTLFPSDPEWEKAYDALETTISTFEKFAGKLGESANQLKEAILFDMSVSRELDRIYTYAHLKTDEDKKNQLYLGFYQKAMTLYTRISEAASFMIPEIQSIPDDVMKGFIKDPALHDYTFYLEKILRNKPHTLSKETEKILAMSADLAHTSSEVFGQLDNSDMTFGMIRDENDRETELSHGNFTTFLMNPKRDIREKAFFQYYKAYRDHQHTLSTTLSASVKKDLFYTQARKFKSCRHASLFNENIPETVYDHLTKTVKNNLTPLLTYLDFRKKTLHLDDLHFYDTYVPLTSDVKFDMPYEEAVDTCVKALKPLGQTYTDVLKKGLVNRWVDRYENSGKRSGAYSSGCYDSPPYILMNYDSRNLNSLYTLIHEAGHSMHSYYAIQAQPYHDHEYTIFVAEVASTLNETLLSHYLLELYRESPEMQSYILNREIDNIRATLYRQTMFAEFEVFTHNCAEKNQPLTLSTLTGEYRKLLETYFGKSLIIDDDLELECLRIPHFYSAFYVYKYATGISAAISLANKIIHIGEKATQAYLDFLKLGGSRFPIDELLSAGVDMRTPEPVENAITHFNNLVERFMDIYGKL
ncbi:MAG: oligoendopeptidase F [Proteobacteria bacterium]|nr:oligoendopeptidase F [Pseudomonadota bacterium]